MCGNHPEYAQRTETVNHPLLPGITDTRLDVFFSGAYASQHLDKCLARARYSGAPHVRLTSWSAPGDSKPSFDEAVSNFQAAEEIQLGFLFGLSWTNHWVKVELEIPEELRSAEQLIFEFDANCEAMVFTPEGLPLHGLSGGPNTMKDGMPGEQEDRRVEHIIPAEAIKAGKYTCYVEVSCNGMFGLGASRYLHPNPNRTFELVAADIILPNPHARGLRTDFRILAEVARHPYPKSTGLGQKALKACDDIMNNFIRADGETAEQLDEVLIKCRKIGWKVLGSLSQEDLKSLAPWKADTEKQAGIWAIGHCHIDTAWLWRYTQTQQKVARSWTSQVDLMDRYPGHQFAASSAVQYKWLETLYPKAFARVSEYVAKGRFHPVGGAWLEHDCMMPSGESLIRHYLYGQRYFKEKFGIICREAFLPDTFGYASQLPQILRSAGLNYFFTQKISWNNINVFPYNTFNWAGIDGTQVLAHMTPVDGYNGQASFRDVVKGIQNNKNLGVTDQSLYLFGNGDGGGGPTPPMLERLERLDSLARNNPEAPSIKIASPIEFFDDLCRKSDGGRKLPTWRGELYLELHRGTYTTQAAIKKGNRDMETLLRDLEYFATLASLKGTYQYPTVAIREIWQEMMLGQFHDCLPGTTIRAVVDDNMEIYARRTAEAEKLLAEAIDSLRTAGGETVIDPLRLAREEVYQSGPGLYSWLSTDASGIGSISSPSGLERPKTSSANGTYTIFNARYTVTIAKRITSIYDHLHSRELVAPGVRTNSAGFMIYEDYPLRYDAWDAEVYHLQMGKEIEFDKVEIKEEGLRSSLVASVKFGKSTGSLTISLDATTPKTINSTPIHAVAEVDWHETHRFLKFALPLDVHSAYATYGTQFGLIERPTHRNTTLDQAKFEVCAHGFADLSEAGYGVAIACRDKYGYAVEGNTMRVSLVRAPTSPDPETDQGKHYMPFAILPHASHLAESDIVQQALRYINHVKVLPGTFSLPTITIADKSSGIVLETIKRGEDDGSKKTVIMRLYEGKGGRARGILNLAGFKVNKAEYVNALEDSLPGDEGKCELKEKDGKYEIELQMRGFEIKSLRLHVE